MEDTLNVSILVFDENTADHLLIRIINMIEQIGGSVPSVLDAILKEESHVRISQLRHDITDLGLQYLKSKMESSPRDFRRIYRMYPDCFMKLCMVLRDRRHLQGTCFISVEEMIVIFLFTVSQNQRYCITTERFDRSRSAISVCFNKALNALVSLAPCMMASPPTDPLEKVKSDSRFWPYFKNCVGAIDDTHIPCMVYSEDQTPYRNRHGYLSQNVFAACTFDLWFFYVLKRWEGSANDSRVLKDALSRNTCKLPLPNDNFYLVDCSCPNRLQFLAPYRGTRYHLKEFGPANDRQRPHNSHELFNHRYASLQNCIEHIFGVFKERFTIFKAQLPDFPYETQKSMVWACVGLHNFLKMNSPNDDFEVSDLPSEAPRTVAPLDADSDEDDDLHMHKGRLQHSGENMANAMWEDGTYVSQGV